MRAWLPVVLVLALAGCGGSDDAPTPSASSASTTPGKVATEASGTVDPLAITSYVCRRNAKGVWKVQGTLENTGKQARDYSVTAFIGQQTGPARVVELDRVRAGASVPFTMDPIVAAPEGPCRLRAVISL
ncbi:MULTISPECIES: hypothetical protein [Aeromicrobium]|uniref:hypothetical protein n=1 Tax=Aeromicrobium TaxID=2040 RepID=UPI00257DC57E|nr:MULTISPECIES: hypothetical protein [Aeromicrobium]